MALSRSATKADVPHPFRMRAYPTATLGVEATRTSGDGLAGDACSWPLDLLAWRVQSLARWLSMAVGAAQQRRGNDETANGNGRRWRRRLHRRRASHRRGTRRSHSTHLRRVFQRSGQEPTRRRRSLRHCARTQLRHLSGNDGARSRAPCWRAHGFRGCRHAKQHPLRHRQGRFGGRLSRHVGQARDVRPKGSRGAATTGRGKVLAVRIDPQLHRLSNGEGSAASCTCWRVRHRSPRHRRVHPRLAGRSGRDSGQQASGMAYRSGSFRCRRLHGRHRHPRRESGGVRDGLAHRFPMRGLDHLRARPPFG